MPREGKIEQKEQNKNAAPWIGPVSYTHLGVDAPIPGVLSIQSVDDVTLTGEIGHEGGFNQ